MTVAGSVRALVLIVNAAQEARAVMVVLGETHQPILCRTAAIGAATFV